MISKSIVDNGIFPSMFFFNFDASLPKADLNLFDTGHAAIQFLFLWLYP